MTDTQQQYSPYISEELHWIECGHLPKSGLSYGIRLLSASDIDDILALQDRVYADLAPEKKNFIVPKDRAFFERHFALGHPMLGVMCQGQIIAQSIIRAPSVHDKDIGMTDMPELEALDPENITILQGVICDPSHRGNHLMQTMVKHWLNWAQDQNRTHALAEIEVRNHYSWSVFMQEGMLLVSMGRDENDKARLYNAFQDLSEEQGKVKYRAMKKLSTTFQAAAAAQAAQAVAIDPDTPDESAVECARNDLQGQHQLMRAGYACGEWDSARQIMQYKRRPF